MSHARGYIQGFRLGGATSLTFKCDLESVIYCGSTTTGVNIISVSEDPDTTASFLLFDIPEGLPEGGYDAFIATPAGLVTGYYQYGQGIKQLGPATISGVIPSSGIHGQKIFVTGRNLLGATGQFLGTDAFFSTPEIDISGVQVVLDDDSWDMNNTDRLEFYVPDAISLDQPKYDSAQSGIVSYELVVSNRNDQWFTGVGNPFDLIPPPVIDGFSPSSGQTGTLITVSGANFINVSSLGFGGYIHASGYVVNGLTGLEIEATTTITSGEIQFEAPDFLIGNNKIHVVATGGTDSSSNDFNLLINKPDIEALIPDHGKRGSTVVISGARMGTSKFVEFSGEGNVASRIIATSFNYLNNSAISVSVPSDAIDGKVRAVNDGGSATSDDIFNIVFDAFVDSISPTTGRYLDVVTVTGFNLSGAEFWFPDFTGEYSITDNIKAENHIYTDETGVQFQVPRETTTSEIYVSGLAGNTFYHGQEFTVLPTISGVVIKSPELPNTIRFAGTEICVYGINAGRANVLAYTGNNQAGAVSLGQTVTSQLWPYGDSGSASSYAYPGYTYFSGVMPYDADAHYFESGYFALGNSKLGTELMSEVELSEDVSGLLHDYNAQGVLDGILFKDRKYQLLPPLPTITSFSPKFGYDATSISLEGYSLTNTTGIMFSGFDAFPSVSGFGNTITVSSDYSLSFYPPSSFSGSGYIVAKNAFGESAVSTGIFTNVRPMNVDGVFPTAGQPFRSFTISGDNLDFVKSIKFGDFEITGFTSYRVC